MTIFLVAVNICDGMTGYIQAGKDGYVIEPVQGKFSSIESEHLLIKVPSKARNLTVNQDGVREKRDAGLGIDLT